MAQCIIDLNAAAGGYEFLAFNHPDPDIRLAASWKFAEIEEMINSGEGGGEKQFQMSNDKFQIEEQNKLNKLKEHNELNKLNELVSDDPLMRKMKKSFEKTDIERKENIEKLISKKNKISEAVKENMKRDNEITKLKQDKAKRNIIELRILSKVEKEKRRLEDMALTTLDLRNEIKVHTNQSIPLEYKLVQNYPNPFNPVSHLEFGISDLGFVSLKVYDVLGKEVATLVNEIRQPGYYSVEFDGSNLSSGIYFYKLEAGSFTQTIRMILLK